MRHKKTLKFLDGSAVAKVSKPEYISRAL